MGIEIKLWVSVSILLCLIPILSRSCFSIGQRIRFADRYDNLTMWAGYWVIGHVLWSFSLVVRWIWGW